MKKMFVLPSYKKSFWNLEIFTFLSRAIAYLSVALDSFTGVKDSYIEENIHILIVIIIMMFLFLMQRRRESEKILSKSFRLINNPKELKTVLIYLLNYTMRLDTSNRHLRVQGFLKCNYEDLKKVCPTITKLIQLPYFGK